MHPKYKNYLTKYSKHLRQKQTPAEVLLWSRLRAKRFLGIKFKRQQPIHKYIVDFYCKEYNLVIEIDGSSHDELRHNHDVLRESQINSLGNSFLRFSEFQVNTDLESVLQTIENYVNGLYEPSL